MKTIVLNTITERRREFGTKWEAQVFCKMFPEHMLWHHETEEEMKKNNEEFERWKNK